MMRSKPLGRFELRSAASASKPGAAYTRVGERQSRSCRGVHDRSQRVSPVSAGEHPINGRGARAGLKTKDCVFWATSRAPLSYFLRQIVIQKPTASNPSASCCVSADRPLAVHNQRPIRSIGFTAIEGKRGRRIQGTKNLFGRNQP